MALIVQDRVKVNTTTTGTGTIVLGATAPTGYQSFAVIGNNNTTYYTIAGQTTNEWEVGIGTYFLANSSLSRTTVLSSSAANAAVSFSAGTKDVFVTYPANRAVYKDETGNVAGYPITGGTINGTLIGNATPSSGAFTTLNASSTASFGGAVFLNSANPLINAGSANLSTGSSSVEVGSGRTGSGYAVIDLVGDTTYPDYGLRVIRNNTGANATSQLAHRGTGNFFITAQEAANITFNTTSIERVRVVSGGNVGIGTTNPQSLLTVAGVIESTTGGIKFPDATVQTTAAAGALSAGNSSIIINNVNITANATIAAGQNGFSVGPVNTANGVSVTVASGQQWVVI